MKKFILAVLISITALLSGCASVSAPQNFADQVKLVCAIAQPNLALLSEFNASDAYVLSQVQTAVTSVCAAPNDTVQQTQFNMLVAASNALVNYLLSHPRSSPPVDQFEPL